MYKKLNYHVVTSGYLLSRFNFLRHNLANFNWIFVIDSKDYWLKCLIMHYLIHLIVPYFYLQNSKKII